MLARFGFNWSPKRIKLAWLYPAVDSYPVNSSYTTSCTALATVASDKPTDSTLVPEMVIQFSMLLSVGLPYVVERKERTVGIFDSPSLSAVPENHAAVVCATSGCTIHLSMICC